jgi:Ca-activated chloride channel family protein
MGWLLRLSIVPLLTVTLAGQFASGVNLVEVYATVTNAQGDPVTDLGRDAFHVLEDGAPQTIAAFTAGDVPLSIVIALDRSFSMAGDRLRTAKRAAATFVQALRPDDEVTILAIGSEVETIMPLGRARDAAATRWETIDPWGATLLYDATREAIDRVEARRGRRALLVISDGVDRGSEISATALIEYARRRDVLVYPIAITKTRPPVLAELAGVTGGRSIVVADPSRLEPALDGLARELRSQYLIGYAPTRPLLEAPAWHAIDVRVDRPGVRVRARDGYYAR